MLPPTGQASALAAPSSSQARVPSPVQQQGSDDSEGRSHPPRRKPAADPRPAATTRSTMPPPSTLPDRHTPSSFSASSSISSRHSTPLPPDLATYASLPLPPPPPPRPRSSSTMEESSSSGASRTAATPLQLHAPIPTEPMPDSILCRSTFAALEHSTSTLKRLAKNVIAQASTMLALMEQLESVEDELMGGLGELGRWLEGGYGVTGHVWDNEGGIRKVASERRRRDREDLEVMVIHPLEAIKGEIKRQGLAGHGAQTKFEGVAKQFYHSTASYLAPTTGAAQDASADLAQATRAAQWELVRYNHHSTLLYAVPPSSVGCLDLLVGLYGWVGANISHVPGKRADTHPILSTDDFGRPLPRPDGTETPTQRGRQLAHSETPIRLLARDDLSARSSVEAVTRSLSQSLGHLVQVRGDLLMGWAERDKQTTLLEDDSRRLSERVPESSRLDLPAILTESSISSFTQRDKPRKKHKIQSSVGGKIRGLFSSSSSMTSSALPSLAERLPPVGSMAPPASSDRATRKSLDLSRPSSQSGRPVSVSASPVPKGPLMPGARQSKSGSRTRHSMHASAVQGDYRSPFNPIEGPLQPSTVPTDRKAALAETVAKLNGASVGGIGGLKGDGDEDEQREQIGRKREGVLWGTGTWEEIDKGGGARGKWEHFWIVLSGSKIYEYRDSSKGESDATVIDLKFASVREGRGTARRFVFEVVTPSQGRRLYQAASEAETKTWMYAICNAIESCINGTSTMRSTDFQALQESMNVDVEAAKLKRGDKAVPRHSLPGLPRESRHVRRPSLKDRLMATTEYLPKQAPPVPPYDSRPTFLAPGGRMPSYPSSVSSGRHTSEADDTGIGQANGNGIRTRAEDAGQPPSSENGGTPHRSPSHVSRTSDRSRAVEEELPAIPPKYDMAMLRSIANHGANAHCADCGRRTKSSRWATLSLWDVPMAMFLCIRCCGLHRGLGTHISKPRSVDLDNWSPEQVLLAYSWGNERGNAVWERSKPTDFVASDENIGEYIQAKYVEARWVSPEDRTRYGLDAGVIAGPADARAMPAAKGSDGTGAAIGVAA